MATKDNEGCRAGILHMNVVKDGDLVTLPAESIYEVKRLVGNIGAGRREGAGWAIAVIKRSEPHYHDETSEEYVVLRGNVITTPAWRKEDHHLVGLRRK